MDDKRYGWPTTRCFPRTIPEAFKDDPANAEWFFPPDKKRGNLEVAMLGIAFWLWLGMAYWYVNT